MTFITAYNPLPISFTHGEGIWLFDKAGESYLDSFSAIAVCGLGHAHPEITETISQQAARLTHCSNAFHIEQQELLAAKLCAISGMSQAFFSNSGAEANEAAIKLARLYGHKKGIETPSIIVMERAFHGRTMATLTASGSRKVQAGFEPLLPGFIRAPFNDLNAIHTIANHRNDIVAVMLEPIQGEGGILVADEMVLRGLETLCRENDWLLILDEVQTGNGRLGHYFASMEYGLKPDIITTAKGLGNGFPIGATLMRGRACDLFKPGNHGSTFGGNPLACAVGLKVIEMIEREKLCEQVRANGIYLKDKLINAFNDHPQVTGIRGKGYMLGIVLEKPAEGLKEIGLKQGILINVTAENVVRLLPPLIITRDEIDELMSRLTQALFEFLN